MGNLYLTIVFLRDIHERYLSLKDVDDEQIKFAKKSKNIDKSMKPVKKKLFISNTGLFFTAREKVLNNFKNRLFPIRDLEPEPEPESEPKTEPKHRKSSLKSSLKSSIKSREEFLNEIVNKEKIINEEIFSNYFKYQNPSSLAKDLFKTD